MRCSGSSVPEREIPRGFVMRVLKGYSVRVLFCELAEDIGDGLILAV